MTSALGITGRKEHRSGAPRRPALQHLTATGELVTIARFAATTRVSRSWLCTRPRLLGKITTLPRPAPGPAGTASVPVSQRASTASLQRRLELVHQRIRQLDIENQRFRAELARAYGQMRASPPPPGNRARQTGQRRLTQPA